jgi:hypothetical protein
LSTTSGKETDEVEGITASFLIASHAQGDLDKEVTAELHELLDAVASTDKKGSLTIKIMVEPFNDVGAYKTTIESKLSAPKPDPKTRLYFLDGHDMVTNDPRQPAIPGLTPPSDDEAPRRADLD